MFIKRSQETECICLPNNTVYYSSVSDSSIISHIFRVLKFVEHGRLNRAFKSQSTKLPFSTVAKVYTFWILQWFTMAEVSEYILVGKFDITNLKIHIHVVTLVFSSILVSSDRSNQDNTTSVYTFWHLQHGTPRC